MRFARAALLVAGVSFVIPGCAGPTRPLAPVGTEDNHAAEADGPPAARPRAPVELETDGIAFERGTSDLQGASGATLDALANAIHDGGEGSLALVRVSLEPDPDACSGDPLARRRAEAIRAALLARGVPATRVRSEGVSSRSPGCAPVLASRSTVSVELVRR